MNDFPQSPHFWPAIAVSNVARKLSARSYVIRFLAGAEKVWQSDSSFPAIHTNAVLVSALGLQPDRKILDGGTFTSVNGADRTWSRLGVGTNLTGSVQFTESKTANFPARFYGVLVP